VIPNFIDCEANRRHPVPEIRQRFAPRGEKLLIHVSNFRPVKRVTAAIEVFARVHHRVPSRLLMVGDGPDLDAAMQLTKALGLGANVQFLGEQDRVVPLLSAADLFLLPSSQESFGLAALEAMACELPVVASRVGGLPEVVEDGVSGFLHAPADLEGMAASAVRLLTDPELHARAAAASRRIAETRYADDQIVPIYEQCYREILDRPAGVQTP
jgi:N-acetyl-alpha-D-glucosaminyl L-malate synthase BshA